jgi:hypothetical protein
LERPLPVGVFKVFNHWEKAMSSMPARLKCAVASVAALMLIGAPVPSQAATGSVRLVLTKAGFIVGVGGGNGTLRFGGRTYGLSVGGISFGTFGASTANLAGTAYNMRRATDIAGTYTAVTASAAVVAGARVAELRNANGVVLRLRGPQVGLEASLDLSGMTIALR